MKSKEKRNQVKDLNSSYRSLAAAVLNLTLKDISGNDYNKKAAMRFVLSPYVEIYCCLARVDTEAYRQAALSLSREADERDRHPRHPGR